MTKKELIPLTLIILIVVITFNINQIILSLEKIGFVLPTNFIIKDVVLETVDLSPFPISKLNNKEFFVYFGYTHCPDKCPITLSELLKLKKSYPQYEVLFINIDQKKYARKSLKKFVQNISDDFIPLNSGKSSIQEILRAFQYGMPQNIRNHLSIVYHVRPNLEVVATYTDFKYDSFIKGLNNGN